MSMSSSALLQVKRTRVTELNPNLIKPFRTYSLHFYLHNIESVQDKLARTLTCPSQKADCNDLQRDIPRSAANIFHL